MSLVLRQGVLFGINVKTLILLSREDEEILQNVVCRLNNHRLIKISGGILFSRGEYLKQLMLSKKVCQVSVEERRQAFEKARLYGSIIRRQLCAAIVILSDCGCEYANFDLNLDVYIIRL